ncbi:MAG: type IV toxin-antitoxin system AbiEi family antitoxin domain-containing protein [Solirubrobacterales bacterium]
MVEELANTTDARVARLAAAQHGVVTTAQLRELGLSVQAVSKRTQRGHLHRVHRGVYAVGHAGLSPHGCWMAAVLAVGHDAVLSHRAAAALWSLLPIGAGVVDATVATVAGARSAGASASTAPAPSPPPTGPFATTSVTTQTRTLLDLARVAAPAELARARRQAEFLGLPLNERRPEVNAVVGPYEADFLWREQRLIVETDGWAAHRGRVAFEQDRRRATTLALDGYEVMRVTWRQVQEEPGTVAAAVRARLRATRASARPA